MAVPRDAAPAPERLGPPRITRLEAVAYIVLALVMLAAGLLAR
ncbi:MAG: hypothetical protein QM772_11450 [Ottowia sp.]